MLFDLRGAGRRRTIQGIYLVLALLMGGGLVLFGIGGSVSGGLVDAIRNDSGGSSAGSSLVQKEEQRLARQVAATPKDATAWAALARARFQLASQGKNYDQQTGRYAGSGIARLRSAERAWDRYLALDPKRLDDRVASLMVQAFSAGALNDPVKAVRAQEVIVERRAKNDATSAGLYLQLAFLAYRAGQERKGDLASRKAIELTPKDLRASIQDRLKAARKTGGSASANG